MQFHLTDREHAFAFAENQYGNISIVIDRIKLEIDIELLFAYEIRNVYNRFDSMTFQFAWFKTRFIEYKMRMWC